MQVVRQIGSGIFYGLVSVMLVVGGLSLALAESYTARLPPRPQACPSSRKHRPPLKQVPLHYPPLRHYPRQLHCRPPIVRRPPDGFLFLCSHMILLILSRRVLESPLINWRKPIVYRRTISNPAITFMFLCHQPLSLFHAVRQSAGRAPILSSREIRSITSPRCTAHLFPNFNAPTVSSPRSLRRAIYCGYRMFPLSRPWQSSLISACSLQQPGPKRPLRCRIPIYGFCCKGYFEGDVHIDSAAIANH